MRNKIGRDMKKILLSLLMLCTVVSAWSLTTTTVTIKCSDVNPLGIVYCDAFMAGGPIDDATKKWQNKLEIIHIGSSCVITSVEFVMSSGSIDKCESTNGKWKVDATGKWEQDGTFAYDENIAFSSTSSCLIEKVTITYHKHTFAHNEGVAASCVAQGRTENWYCSDCGHTYYDNAGANEVAKEEDLVLLIDPTNHASTLTKHEAVAATCVSTGSVLYWHCSDCDHCFKDEAGTTQIAGDDVTTAIDPTNHADKLKEVAFKNASVVEDGVYHHWHCQACDNDYADADATENMNGKTAKAKYDADALLIGNTMVDESYLFDGAKVTFDGDNVVLAMGDDKQQYELSETERLMINFSHTFQLKANKDPNHTTNYYSTFYTGEGAYKVPETAKAYAGKVETGEETDVLKLADVGNIIHKSEAVILKATGSDITLMPSYNKAEASTGNVLEGTDEATTLSANQYALSLGQNGVGFYLWEGKAIGANKAYLTLDGSAGAKAFIFQFDNGETTGIQEASPTSSPEGKDLMYNLNGVRVNDHHKGIVIKNGKKIYQK